MRDFLKKFELYIGSFFIAITTIVVVMNVFTRYVLKFTYFWAEEIAVGCFVWTIFLGTAAAYREKALIGVEAVVVLLPKKIRKIVEFLVYILLFILSSLMFYFSYTYVASSSKITAALEISYAYINSSIIISFGLMSLYSLLFVIESFKELIKGKE
ncbi:TRAP transporter small permease [Fusobacterium perfoetens]|uniref:TRAP transporter small permease n=1 Tax=Fusobacterium perfoetens TaxID=852 RepID=UPI0004831724|nr:TRAP transporter small permease [Fusobacterium perfoetens]MCI6152824.1 TRAP transporter small permease [Fusobacterium perfoetens]MDY3237234.1 TRAP transporter small permease [Fusobacterium perfoetens]